QRTDLFNARIQGAVVRNRLFGRNIALVCNPLTTSADELPAVRRTLEDAGATVTTEILLKPALEQVTPQQLQKVTQQAAFPNTATQITADDLLNRLAAAIGSSTAAIIPVLQQTNLLKVNGDPTKPISAIVYLGGIDDAGKYLNDIDIPFLHGCTQRGITVAATECVESEQSAMAEYKKVAPITIDNIDRAAGRIAMVLALSTGQHGNYGYKDTAEDVVPDCE
ncbi:MAG TPA: copper transporter, partial [Armatimonadota bacterium]|nr:copper transporter [Armatimonadota bacterium]